MKIVRLETDLLRVPLSRPVSLPTSQDPKSASSVDAVVVRLLTDGPHTGLGFTYSFGGGEALRSILDEIIAPIVVGANPAMVESLFARSSAELEGLGFVGLAARAYAAVDFALWDWKGKAAHAPVHQLLGGYRTQLKAIAADTATPALGSKLAAQASLAALDRGAGGIQIEVGTLDPELDLERLRQLRDAIPEGAWFELNCSGRYDFSTAVWLGTVGNEEFGLDGFCDPLAISDRDNLRRLCDRLDVGVSVGANFDRVDDFALALAGGGLSCVRIDPLRLGGLTPSRKVALLAELKNVAIYPYRSPEVGSHLAAASLYGRMCETVDWFTGLFTGGPSFRDGHLVVSDAPGLGLELNEMNAVQWRV